MKRQRLQRLARLLAGDDNPLRRPVDKIESAFMVGLVIAFLIAAPLLAIYAGRQADVAGLREQRAESEWRQVTAVLQQSAGAGLIGVDGAWDTSWVRASWTLPGAGTRTGLIAVGLNARGGQRVQVWVTSAGQLTHAPFTRADLLDQVAFEVFLVTTGLAAVLALGAVAIRVTANRRRMTAWTRAWATTGPRWSSRR